MKGLERLVLISLLSALLALLVFGTNGRRYTNDEGEDRCDEGSSAKLGEPSQSKRQEDRVKGFRWRWFLWAALLVVVVLLVIAAISPALPGPWCSAEESVWRVCYREWLGALSGWAAFVAALIALDVQQSLSERDYRQTMREANRTLLARLDELFNNVVEMRQAGVEGRQIPTGDLAKETYLMNDALLGPLEQVSVFKEARFRACQEAMTFNHVSGSGHETSRNHEFLGVLVKIDAALRKGRTIGEIADEMGR